MNSKRWSLCTGPAGMWKPTLHERKKAPGQKRNVIKKHPRVAARLQQAVSEFMASRGAEEWYIEKFTRI